MVGALALVGSSVVDSHTSPCLCLEALPSSSLNHKSGGDLVSQRSSAARKHLLSSSFVDSGHELKLLVKAKKSRKPPKHRSLVIVNELAGQYEDSFEDVKTVCRWDLSMCLPSPIKQEDPSPFPAIA